jgi:hypothetical protein
MLVPVILAAVLAALVLWTLSDVQAASDEGLAVTLVLGVGALLVGAMIASGSGSEVARYPSSAVGVLTNAGLVFIVALPLTIGTGLGRVLRRRSTIAAAAFVTSASVILGMLVGVWLAP